jgi:hypothetical protein
VRSLLGLMGGDCGVGNFIFRNNGRNDILYTHLGCFGAPGGVGVGAKSFENGFQKSGLPN